MLFLLLACKPGSVSLDDRSGAPEVDADTDTDADADSDADTDADSDADTDLPTGTYTGETAGALRYGSEEGYGWECTGTMSLVVSESGQVTGEIQCGTGNSWEECAGPVTGEVVDGRFTGTWAAEINYAAQEVPVEGDIADGTLDGGWALESAWLWSEGELHAAR